MGKDKQQKNGTSHQVIKATSGVFMMILPSIAVRVSLPKGIVD